MVYWLYLLDKYMDFRNNNRLQGLVAAVVLFLSEGRKRNEAKHK